MASYTNFPPQTLPFTKKNKEWRKKCVMWAQNKTFFNYSLVRNSVMHKKINYDLLNGKIHMRDIEHIVNPENIKLGETPEKIQHYPIINSKLNVLKGEELKRPFDYKVIITNPNALAEIENNKKEEVYQRLQSLVQSKVSTEEEYNKEIDKISDYFSYEWQDLREIRGNALLNHYAKEYNMPLLFNTGFSDSMIVSEEIYQCDIVGGEPIIEKLNPLKVRVFKSGYSNKIEDAEIIVLEDYWNPAKIIDTYYESLTSKDIKYIESLPDNVGQGSVDSMDNLDERFGFINTEMLGEEGVDGGSFFFGGMFGNDLNNSLLPYDLAGNLRVLRVFWKSRRKIKKIKSYDVESGEEIFNFYPENYVIDTSLGEEEQIFYINEAWEGTMIGNEIFVNMRPRVIQYNRLSNPSRCHFGIIGSIYNTNDSTPFSLVDMMKPYSYMYDIYHDRLNKAIAVNWGKLVQLDLSKIPKGWDVHKWMYYAKVNHIAVIDSFNEGNIGSSTGKLAGAMNSASSGVIDAETGNYIQQHINLLEFIKLEMSEVAGISRQREGQISNRETVGGIERSTLQSSHITEWLFSVHEDVKKRALECFLETAKIALKGRSKKFQYLLSDASMQIIEIDGDEFAEADYGLVVHNGNSTVDLNSKLDTLAQAALQNSTLSFAAIMKLYSSSSISEKQRIIEKDEKAMQERQSQAQQSQQETQEKLMQMQLQQKQEEMQLEDQINIRDNETKLLIATMNKDSDDGIENLEYTEENKQELLEKIRQFDEKLKLEKEKLSFDKLKSKEEIRVKEKAISTKNSITN